MEAGDAPMLVDITDEAVTEDEAIEDESVIKEFKCETCLKVLETPNALECHIRRSHKIKEKICDICGYSFENGVKLSDHKRSIHLWRSFPTV